MSNNDLQIEQREWVEPVVAQIEAGAAESSTGGVTDSGAGFQAS